jgi:hypothetical protein
VHPQPRLHPFAPRRYSAFPPSSPLPLLSLSLSLSLTLSLSLPLSLSLSLSLCLPLSLSPSLVLLRSASAARHFCPRPLCISSSAALSVTVAALGLLFSRFVCPRCDSRLCERSEPPTTCPVCQIRLASPAHLARTYHHLFPVPLFVAVDGRRGGGADSSFREGGTARAALGGVGGASGSDAVAAGGVKPGALSLSADGDVEMVARGAAALSPRAGVLSLAAQLATHCYACVAPLGKAERFACPKCRNAFCGECDVLIHESLHNCPGCC